MLIEACKVGGAGAEWIKLADVTTSPYTLTASWDYDADVVLMLCKINNNSHVIMYEVATSKMYYADSSNGWSTVGVDSRFSFTSRSLTGSFGLTTTDISILPVVGKPTGYYL